MLGLPVCVSLLCTEHKAIEFSCCIAYLCHCMLSWMYLSALQAECMCVCCVRLCGCTCCHITSDTMQTHKSQVRRPRRRTLLFGRFTFLGDRKTDCKHNSLLQTGHGCRAERPWGWHWHHAGRVSAWAPCIEAHLLKWKKQFWQPGQNHSATETVAELHAGRLTRSMSNNKKMIKDLQDGRPS